MPVAQLLSGERVLVCDGAMGTMLHAAGAALDRSLPELNLSDPSLVATIHDSYLSAGADIIQANTFGANRLWLADHGFPDKVAEINRAGVRLAREAADRSGRQVLVAASVSPAVTAPQRRRVGAAERMEVLREQILALIADNAADLIILETFGYLDELVEAVSVAAAVTSLPLIAQATFADDAHTLGGETPREVASVLSALPVAMIGTNCTVGPQRMLVVAEDLVRYSAVPVSAQPNAGQPRRTGPRSFEFAIDGGYFSRYLTRFADAGVTLVGGCCGTTPTHIRAAAEALRTQPAAQPRPQVAPRGVAARIAEPMAGGPASGSLADHLASGRFVVSAAITPPAAGWAGDAERAAAEFADRGIGLVFVQPRENARTHMDSLNMALALQQRVGVETIPTITTWDKSIMSLQADLLGAHALGVRSVVSTTGSPPVFGDYPAVDGTWEVDSVGLTALLAGLNAGRDSNGLALTARTSFCIGARVNPTARDHDAELARVRAKLRAGAQFLVCRPVYELDALIRLVEALDGTGVPLLLSVTPLASFEDADYLAHEVPGVAIPSATLDVMERAGRSGGRAAGIDLAASLLAKARPLVSGVILTAPGDDPAALAPLIDALG
ncbi:bifunctional homocysteine S-methyltransferase/methylenetetrahydrofolate reductase [Trebonia kvetii]|uniref:Bifunctional homocysteine S-methyltransferase/methylenetetrahydrofolate reductase n=1 Tax=Trebonia kvetii TaxID=2480626 RepID=A0A6P2C8I4_9ACTN|nr:bifunctional homocysteine S-methyltransferase/methylenetetrahydrofolate reductase [Trebonia kvetii]